MIQKIEIQTPAQKQASPKVAQKHFRVAEPDLPKLSFSARVIKSVDELNDYYSAWSRLVDTSIRANPFFDPDFLIPAINHLGNGQVSVVVVEAEQRISVNAPKVMCGLFPVVKTKVYGMPVSCLEIWKHDHCFDCTPLIRRDCAAQVLDFVLDYVGNQMQANLLSMNTIAGEGPFLNLLTDCFFQNSQVVFQRDQFTRSCFKPMRDAETYINSKVAKNTRKGTQRLRRKLAAQGKLETRRSTPANADWIDEFLDLEVAGWKGKAGSALASKPSANSFFREMAQRMIANDKLEIVRTSLDNRPISMFCDLKQKNRASHFKTTFDESLKEFSPGLITELDNIQRLHETKTEFVDSCADPDHSMINRVWGDRVRFQSLVVALRGPVSQVAVSTMPMIQLAGRYFKKKQR